MTLQNPQPLLDRIDFAEYDRLREHSSAFEYADELVYSEPSSSSRVDEEQAHSQVPPSPSVSKSQLASLPDLIKGRIQRFGDNVDTDSIAPTEICIEPTPEKLARGAFCHVKPSFYDLAQAGATVLVAQNAFGTGSSREQATKALLAAGIKAVIAKSYAFIYGRNQANNGLLGIKLQNDRFYELADEGAEISIDIRGRTITCGGEKFDFQLDPIEESLLAAGGLLKMYNLYGTKLFKKLQEAGTSGDDGKDTSHGHTEATKDSKLEW
jgi:homoaconitate hydratase